MQSKCNASSAALGLKMLLRGFHVWTCDWPCVMLPAIICCSFARSPHYDCMSFCVHALHLAMSCSLLLVDASHTFCSTLSAAMQAWSDKSIVCRSSDTAEMNSIKSGSSVSSKKGRKSELISILKKPKLSKSDILQYLTAPSPWLEPAYYQLVVLHWQQVSCTLCSIQHCAGMLLRVLSVRALIFYQPVPVIWVVNVQQHTSVFVESCSAWVIWFLSLESRHTVLVTVCCCGDHK